MTSRHGSTATYEAAAPWDRLRTWIAEKEAWEREHHHPATLTPAERAAIANLVPLVVEPDVSKGNYVGALGEYSQGKRERVPTYRDQEVPLVLPNGITQLRWRCFCDIDWCGQGPFPCEGYGFDAMNEAPSFQSKKSAKQFAAQQALKFLREGPGQTTASTLGPDMSSPSRDSPLSKKLKVEEGSHVAAIPAQQPERPREPESITQTAAPVYAYQSSVLQQVAELANRLGFGQPSYDIEDDDENPGFYRGRPRFADDPRIPDGLGVVTLMYGRKKAKLEVAQKVLEWMLDLLQERQNTLATMTNGTKINGS